MAEPVDINVDELRRRARRRLVGAVVLALGIAVVVPMLLETEQKPLGEDVSVKIPPIDEGRFVNRLNDPKAGPAKAAEPGTQPPVEPAAPAAGDSAPRASKYDTRIPDSPPATQGTATAASSAPGADVKVVEAAKASEAKAASTQAAAKAGTAAESQVPGKGSASEAASPAAANDKRPNVETSTTTAPASQAIGKVSNAGEKPVSVVDKIAAASGSHREGFAVQLAAFADDRGANSLAGRLKRAGYTAYTEPLKTSKGTLWRVRVGPYPSREAAVAARDKLKTEGQNGIVAAVK